jgi:hypothetical protein
VLVGKKIKKNKSIITSILFFGVYKLNFISLFEDCSVVATRMVNRLTQVQSLAFLKKYFYFLI